MRAYHVDLGFHDVRIGKYQKFVFDDEGIPRFHYPWGDFYNAAFVCHYGLYHLSRFIKFETAEDIDIFMHVAKWIAEHGSESDGSFLFSAEFDWGPLKAPWISALWQGCIISVLTRAWAFSKDESYLVKACKAMRPLEIPVAEGGLQTRYPDGSIAFEEAPTRVPSIVLNGLITAIFGLFDLAEIARERKAADLLKASVASLEMNIWRYDLGYWSTYDLARPRHIAPYHYHRYHVMQLWALHEMTGRETFRVYSLKWEAYEKKALNRGLMWFYLLRYQLSNPKNSTNAAVAKLRRAIAKSHI